ncbi:MAG: branched-chain-amino-acid transaminase [Firmicutes bacterium]|nr:branched-chain-amino-acid transaminase [Alicyclobacillaceae bacterium]MCL6497563.1 branched-chain-amino-acid transaminase [Bacillota bacterium]
MAEDRWIYLNGELVPKAEARVSVFDHGFLYGDGIFEGIRVYGGRVFKLDEHLRRLYESAKAILLDIPLDPAAMKAAVLDTTRKNGLADAYIRLVVSRGPGDLGLDPRRCTTPTVLIIVDEVALYPPKVYQEGLELASVSIRRMSPETINPAIKSLNYLNNILAKIEANQRGLAEVLMLNQQGWVVEGTGDNVFIVKDGELITPPPYVGILNGITRQVVMQLAREMGLPCREAIFNLFDVYNADECFLTGTAAEIVPAVRCDGRQIGSGQPGAITLRLTEAFQRYARSEGTPVWGTEPVRA